MNYEVVTLPEKYFLGKGLKTTNENNQALTDIGGIWKEIFEKDTFSSIKNRKNTQLFGLYTKYEKDYTKPYYFYACCEIENKENLDSTMEVFTIPSAKYAKFSMRGNFYEISGKLWETVWQSDLERKYTYDFDVYYYDDKDPNDQLLEIYIAI